MSPDPGTHGLDRLRGRLGLGTPLRGWLTEERLAIALPLLLVIAAYANSLYNGFAFDDVIIVEANPRVHRIFDLGPIWLTPYWPYHEGEAFGLYRPLAIFAYAVQWMFSGGDPFLFHLVNLVLHGAVTLAVFKLLRALSFDAPAASLAAAVFAVHPVHVEAVANVVGQAEMIGAVAVVAACTVYLRRTGDRLTLARAVGIGVLYLMGMLAKENAIVLPALIVAVDLAQRRLREQPLFRRGWKDLVGLTALLGAVALAYLALRVDVLGSIGGTDAGPTLPFLREEGRLFSALRAWPEFARLLFWPMDLIADYSPAVILPAESFTPMVVLGLVLLIVTVILALVTPWKPVLGLPAAWFLICILPVSNLVVPIGVLIAERTLYLPSLAVSLVVAGLCTVRGEPRARRVLAVAAVAVLVAFTIRTITRNPVWYSTDTVLQTLLDEHPESYRGQWRVAAREAEHGTYEKSLYHFELGYRLWPRNTAMIIDYADFHLKFGRPERAVELVRLALAEEPGSDRAKVVLAAAYLRLNDFAAALEVSDELIRKLGAQPTVLRIRARALTALGRTTEALDAWRRAMRSAPSTASDWIVYARALQMGGRLHEALKALDAAEARIRGADAESSQAIAAGRRQIQAEIDG